MKNRTLLYKIIPSSGKVNIQIKESRVTRAEFPSFALLEPDVSQIQSDSRSELTIILLRPAVAQKKHLSQLQTLLPCSTLL